MILISQTFETYSPESAENGEPDDTGFYFKNVPHSFRELVDLIEAGGFYSASDSHGVPRWLSSYAETTDDYTGEHEIRSIHPGNDRRSQRYWAKAVAYALR